MTEIDPKPYQRLLRAVVMTALSDAAAYFKRQQFNERCPSSPAAMEGREAIAWLFSENEKPFSFLWCCENSGLNHRAIRQRLSKHPTMHVRAILRAAPKAEDEETEYRAWSANTKRSMPIEE